jgi:hypothetical protein
MNRHLERLARRVADDHFFLAAVLARYATARGLDDAGLAAVLACSPETLMHLRLCRNPDHLPPHFGKDVETIAGKFGLDPDVFAEVVRLGQSLLGVCSAERDQEQERDQPDKSREAM